jgi:hypothetical protein
VPHTDCTGLQARVGCCLSSASAVNRSKSGLRGDWQRAEESNEVVYGPQMASGHGLRQWPDS